MSYNSKRTGAEVEALLDKAGTALQEHQDISGKQDVISDLDTIRSGASKGATSVQPADLPSVPTKVSAFTNDSGYQNATQVSSAISAAIASKANISTVSDIQTTLNNLISGGDADKIDDFNDIVAFLDGIPPNQTTLGEAFSVYEHFFSGLSEVVSTKADQSGLETLEGTVSTMQTTLAGKADVSDIPTVPTKVSAFTNDSGYQNATQVSSAISSAIADKADSATYTTQSGVTSATIQPNTFTDFGTVTALTITLGSVASDATLEERMFGFQFTSGTTATTLTLPDTVKFPEDPTIEAGYTYQVTILNNLALISGWPNS